MTFYAKDEKVADRLPGATDPLPGATDPLPGPTDPLPGPTDALPGPTNPLPRATDPLWSVQVGGYGQGNHHSIRRFRTRASSSTPPFQGPDSTWT